MVSAFVCFIHEVNIYTIELPTSELSGGRLWLGWVIRQTYFVVEMGDFLKVVAR